MITFWLSCEWGLYYFKASSTDIATRHQAWALPLKHGQPWALQTLSHLIPHGSQEAGTLADAHFQDISKYMRRWNEQMADTFLCQPQVYVTKTTVIR